MTSTEDPGAFLRRKNVVERTGLSTSEIDRRVREGRFPKPVMLGPQTTAWAEAEVIEWQRELIRRRDERADVGDSWRAERSGGRLDRALRGGHMYSKIDKAGAAAIGAGVATIATHFLGPEVGGAIGVLVTAVLVYACLSG